ncbi:MAG: STAS domain-containing protein [Acidimicrobiales bacterium]
MRESAGQLRQADAEAHEAPALGGELPCELTIRLVADADRSVLLVRGELDMATETAFGGFLDVAARRRPTCLVVDLEGVTCISASGLGQLARILPRLEAAGGTLAITSTSPSAYRVLDVAGLTTCMHVEPPTPEEPRVRTARRRPRPSRARSQRHLEHVIGELDAVISDLRTTIFDLER